MTITKRAAKTLKILSLCTFHAFALMTMPYVFWAWYLGHYFPGRICYNVGCMAGCYMLFRHWRKREREISL